MKRKENHIKRQSRSNNKL